MSSTVQSSSSGSPATAVLVALVPLQCSGIWGTLLALSELLLFSVYGLAQALDDVTFLPTET